MSKVCQNLYQRNVVSWILFINFRRRKISDKYNYNIHELKQIFPNVSYNHFHQNRSILTPFVIVLTWCILRCVWTCVEFNVTPGHGFSFGSQSAYVRGKSMYGIFLLWNNSFKIYLFPTFSVLWQEYVGAHT